MCFEASIVIETKRLRIYPASREAMETLIESQTDKELKAAYSEMLEGCTKHPEQWLWHATWIMELKDGTHIGDLSFKGLTHDSMVEIGYGILPSYENNGYATEAVSAITSWAVRQPEVSRVEAETDFSNAASQRVLQKCGYLANGSVGAEGPRFVFKKP